MNSARALAPGITVDVEIIQGPAKGGKASFNEPRWTIGRGPENRLVISQDIKVSRSHVEIRCLSSQVFARSLSKKNPMMIDGNLTVEGILKPGATLQIGETLLRFKYDNEAVQSALALRQGAVDPARGGQVARGSAQPPAGVVFQPPGQLPPQYPPPRAPRRTVEPPLMANPKFRFYLLIIGLGLGAYYFFNETPAQRRVQPIRDSSVINVDVETSETEVKRLTEERKDFASPQYQLAQAQFIKGFRDYQKGQYSLAMESFQAARGFYPRHELATKYWTLAKRRFDEQVQGFMIQGRRYRGSQNYRLCQSSFAAVLMLVKDDKAPIYQEARQYHDECRIKGAGS